jgi:site-specific recombinase XerD
MARMGAAPGGGERYYQAADPLIGDFMAELLRKNRSPRTMEAYARDLEHFGAYLTWGTSERPDVEGSPAPATFPALRTADASAIRRYVLYLMTQRRYRVVAVRRNLSALRTFYGFLRREGVRADHPALDVDLPKPEQRKPKVLRLSEVASIVKTRVDRPRAPALAVRDRAMIELLYGSGIRRAELAGLDLDDVDLGARVARVTGKGNKSRMVPLTEASAMAMRSYLTVRPGSSDRAFFLGRDAQRLGLRQVWKIVKDYAHHSGIDRASTHAMRHSFATHFIEGGGDLSTLQKLLGHANISTTQVYLDQSIGHLRKAFDAAHPRDHAAFDEALAAADEPRP